MQNGHPVSEPLAKPLHSLRGERDFGDHHDRGFALFQDALNATDIYFCLAASCHAMQ